VIDENDFEIFDESKVEDVLSDGEEELKYNFSKKIK